MMAAKGDEHTRTLHFKNESHDDRINKNSTKSIKGDINYSDTKRLSRLLSWRCVLSHPRPVTGEVKFDDLVPFCLNLKKVDGIVSPAAAAALVNTRAEYQLSVSLYDVAFRQFCGRQWLGPTMAGRGGATSLPKLQYNQHVYFHTCITNISLVAVVEIIAHTYDDSGQRQAVACGWGFIRPFKNNDELPDSARNIQLTTQQKIEMYYGSPRALLFMDDPLESNQLLKPITGCQLSCTVATHKSMLRVMNLIPENVIVSGKDVIPGVVDDQTAGADKLKRPKMLRTVPMQLEGVFVHLQPNMDMFETELCTLLQDDRAIREKKTLEDAPPVTVIERRLQVGVHNGWCYVEKPQTFHLESLSSSSRKPTASPSFRSSSMFTHRRTGSTGSRVKMSLSFARAHTRTVSVRWAAVSPFQHPNKRDITISLIGGPHRSPDEGFVYKMPSTDMQDNEAARLAGGYIFLQWSTDAKDMLMLPTGSPRGMSLPLGSMPSVRSQDSGGELDLAWKPPTGRSNSQGYASQTAGYQVLPGGPRSFPPSEPGAQHAALPRDHLPYTDQTHISFQPQPQILPQQAGYSHAQPPGMGAVYSNMALGPGSIYGMPMYPTNIMQMTDPGSVRFTAPDLHELPFTPVHAPVMAQGPQPRGGVGLSRSAYARLYSAGFPPVVDRNGDPPDVIDPGSTVTVNVAKELADPLQCNEIVFQFLAFAKFSNQPNGSSKSAGSVFFTFQFYRFPQITSERLLLSKSQNDLTSDPQSMPFILHKMEKDGSVQEGQPPGFEVKYFLDPTFLKPGESSLFYQHLSRQSLHIDVWDGDSLLLIGSSALDLKYLCRNGNEAVQTTFELDVVTSEYHEDTMSGDNKHSEVRAASVKPLRRGKLHLRMANIGHQGEVKRIGHRTETIPLPSKTQVIISQTAGNSSYKGGSLIRGENGLKKLGVSRAQPLTDNREVASMMFSKERLIDKEETQRGGDSERQRKLSRMNAVRQQSGEQENEKTTTIIGYRKEKAERTRDIKTMEIYRMQTKREGILTMLSNTITTEHTIYPTFATAEFFEFVLKNPYNVQQSISMECSDPAVGVITDAREWRHFKQINNINTHVEEGMFSKESKSNGPEIFLRPKETVNIPLKYQSFHADQSVQPQGPVNPFRKKEVSHKQGQEESNILHSRSVRIIFKSEDGKPIAVLHLKVEPQPHVVDQTFRFFHPEQSFLKKSIRLQDLHALPANQIGGSGVSKVYVRCSDTNVVCDSRATQPGEPHDVFVKCPLGPSPQVKRFHMAVYIDPYLSRPTQVWQFFVHALQRVDVSCIDGQTSRFALILRGTQSNRLCCCFSSHPNEMQLSPDDQFLLTAGAVHELNVAVRPMKTGNRFYYLNVVDIEYHQLIRTWLICVNCRAPMVSRAFELSLPVGGGKGCSKRISYTNPYAAQKEFHLSCDRDDLLQFKESKLTINGGEQHVIGLRFNPVSQPGIAEIMVFINDEDDKNEETFRITANYKYPGA
ncbi:LOW QUALITY PROTEIN: nephrocystin-4-like [Haliotis rubra]|uniref:LOW QUALITY PROTEIN: nephrocystin-4-like n=1 Tax=Haliotis rubra TaxID=36100 RepID=UPI001EE63624|nr:LOW QUALITY PROTEIN: nephrocystin-4-like [Haliotis rubra]